MHLVILVRIEGGACNYSRVFRFTGRQLAMSALNLLCVAKGWFEALPCSFNVGHIQTDHFRVPP